MRIVFLSIFLVFCSISDSLAQNVLDIIRKSNELNFKFKGIKTQNVVRQNLYLEAKAKVNFQDSDNFLILITEPSSISGINILTKNGKSSMYFPNENLAFTNVNKKSADFINNIVFNKISDNVDLLKSNYSINLKDDDEILGIPTYVIDIKPFYYGNNNYWITPARKYWISKKNYLIMKEERTWISEYSPFFISQYTEYNNEENNEDLNIDYKSKDRKTYLGFKKKDSETFMESFNTVKEAEAFFKTNFPIPNYLPKGFLLNKIEVLNFYDTKIVVQEYYDGLNKVYLTYRPKPNIFLTLLAGNFSLSLIRKLSDLSYHAPFNYYTKDSGQHIVISFGDLHPDELKKLTESVNIN
jgi:hypothetical protein